MKKYHRGAGFIILVMALVFSLSSLRTGIIHASNPSSAPAACNDMPDAEARTLTVAFSPVPGICAPDAVSYTHLDVYKRQPVLHAVKT